MLGSDVSLRTIRHFSSKRDGIQLPTTNNGNRITLPGFTGILDPFISGPPKSNTSPEGPEDQMTPFARWRHLSLHLTSHGWVYLRSPL
jgi:hypothetical protein